MCYTTMGGREISRPTTFSPTVNGVTSFQEIILSSGFFRRETASGFYPWKTLVRGWRRDCVVGGMETRFQ